MPRSIDGHPDLQGVWENNTITPVERPDVFGDKQFLTDEDVEFLKQRLEEIYAAGDDALFGLPRGQLRDGEHSVRPSCGGENGDPGSGQRMSLVRTGFCNF